MTMRFSVQAICPECGNENGLTVTAQAVTSREMHTCNRDTCGKEFVVEVTVPAPTVKVLKLTEVTG